MRQDEAVNACPDERAIRPSRQAQMRFGQILGLLFVVGPIVDLARSSASPLLLATTSLGLAAFIGLYLALLPPVRPLARRGPPAIWAALALLALLAGGILAAGAPGSFGELFFYVIAAVGILLPAPAAIALILAITAGLSAGVELGGSDASTTSAVALTALAVGTMMVVFGRKIEANRQLEAARDELARLAVTEERLRISRDVHDLLGHSLSTIALKSELAHKLIASDPLRARAELEDVQEVTRQALSEVRAAVQGYRRMALSDALGGARAAFSAAGIDCQVDAPATALPGEVEDVLAWGLREATTNVVRHSGARSVVIRLKREWDRVALEVDDDGTAAGSPTAGSGLAGLAERAERVQGTLEAGAGEAGGFRLRLSVPLALS
jgi:two-component system sensor histidine kinase DesK